MDKDNKERITIKIDPKQTPRRIDHFLIDRLFNISRSRLQRYIKNGDVLVNDKIVKPNYLISPGEEITVLLPNSGNKQDGITPEDIELNIVFEDEHILVVDKKAGMVVHPGIQNDSGTLVNAVAHYLSNHKLPIMQGNLSDRPGLVHRIDKDTSGLLVLAKNEDAMTKLAKQFFDHSIHRRYQAIVWGGFDEKEGVIDEPIGRHPRNRVIHSVVPIDEGGKRAVTRYKVLRDLYYISLVQCELETGRTHQIRVHMDHIGHTLFNDEKYGGNRVLKGTVFSKYKRFVENTFEVLPRQGLHAIELGFIHPATNEEMLFKSELPEDMKECLTRWENYLNSRKTLM